MMRRADREVADPRQVEAIVATCKIVNIAYTDAEGITIVPLNFGYVFDTESNHLTFVFPWFCDRAQDGRESRPRATRFL